MPIVCLQVSLISHTSGELICNLRIDPDLFVPDAVSLGRDEVWRLANERYAEWLRVEARNPENGLRPNQVGQKEQCITHHVDIYYRETTAEDRDLYGVKSNSKGEINPGLELAWLAAACIRKTAKLLMEDPSLILGAR